MVMVIIITNIFIMVMVIIIITIFIMVIIVIIVVIMIMDGTGGQQEWIDQGLAAAPIKIQKLYELNKILAHRPWSLTQNHIEELTKPGQDNWSLSELVYAIVLMVHFHAFSSFIQCCVLMESDEAPADDAGSDSSSGPPYDCTTQRRSSLSPQLDKVEELLQRMETLKGKQTALPPKEELTVRFRTVELSSVGPETLTV